MKLALLPGDGLQARRDGIVWTSAAIYIGRGDRRRAARGVTRTGQVTVSDWYFAILTSYEARHFPVDTSRRPGP